MVSGRPEVKQALAMSCCCQHLCDDSLEKEESIFMYLRFCVFLEGAVRMDADFFILFCMASETPLEELFLETCSFIENFPTQYE